jgi:hypothetical protein
MKRWVIYYLVISLLFGAIIYLITLFQISQEKTNEAFISLTNEVYQTKNIRTFTRYSTRGYEQLYREETSSYVIEIIQALGSNEGLDLHQLVIFVIPQDKESITYAREVTDRNDESQLILTSETFNFNSKDDVSLKDYALSVGIETLGFYYYALTIENDLSGIVMLYDYEGTLILETELSFTYVFEEETFIEGMSDEEIELSINADEAITETLINRLLIFASIDLLLAMIISMILRRRTT